MLSFLFSARCNSDARLDDKTAIITGANSGIGRATAKDFYQRGCRVIMACRDTSQGEQAAEEIKHQLKDQEDCGELVIIPLDLASLMSVRTFAHRVLNEEPKLNILVNNAGVFMCPYTLTEDNVELHFQTNYLGHFLLTLLLMPRLIKSAPARVVIVGSTGVHGVSQEFDDINWEKSDYSPATAYLRSKLACFIFAKELSRQLEGKNVNVYAVRPGWTRTSLDRHLDTLFFPGFRSIVNLLVWFVLKSPEQGAQTHIHCSVDEKVGGFTGCFFENCEMAQFPVSIERKNTEALWIRSTNVTKYHGNPFVAG